MTSFISRIENTKDAILYRDKTREKMNKKAFVGLLILIALTTAGFFIWQKKSNQASVTRQPAQAVDILQNHNDSVPQTWKTYSDDRLGLTFKYPSSWVKQGKDAEAVNLSGVTTVIGVYFSDTISKTIFSIEYHLPPNGAELYRYTLSQYDSSRGWYAKDGKKIQVAGNEAIEANTILSVNGKGKKLNPPLRVIIVDFLDRNQTGEMELQFTTPLPQEEMEVDNFKRLLSTIKFL